jgi:2-hydroxychromene-2-carboxylate isomerase
MSTSITFYYDFVSPYSYLASTQLPAFLQRTGANIVYKPIHILTVMDAVGNTPTTATCRAKGKYALSDLARWASHYSVPLSPHSQFGRFSTLPFLHGALAAEAAGQLDAYNEAVFDALWVRHADIESDEGITGFLSAAGIEGATDIWGERKAYAAQLENLQQEAIDAGVFGVPSFVTKNGLYFGNDRLNFLEEGLNV